MRGLILSLLVLPCGAADKIPDLSHVREVNLERAAKFPNFVADETALRYRKSKADSQWQATDRIESEIAIGASGRFTRQKVRLNGREWTGPFPAWDWSVAFGDEITALFDKKCPTVIEFEGNQEWEGKPVQAYSYHSPADGCFGSWTTRSGFFSRLKKYNPARRGRFLVDSKANLVRFEIEAIDFPKNFGKDTWTEATSWDYVRIGEESFLLPVEFEIVVGSTTGELLKAHVEYRNHRHFEASAEIGFQP